MKTSEVFIFILCMCLTFFPVCHCPCHEILWQMDYDQFSAGLSGKKWKLWVNNSNWKFTFIVVPFNAYLKKKIIYLFTIADKPHSWGYLFFNLAYLLVYSKGQHTLWHCKCASVGTFLTVYNASKSQKYFWFYRQKNTLNKKYTKSPEVIILARFFQHAAFSCKL